MIHRCTNPVTWAVFLLASLSLSAFAQDDMARLGVQLRTKVQAGGQPPAFIINPQVPIKSLKITLKSATKRRTTQLRIGRLGTGAQHELPWRQPIGTDSFTAKGDVVYANGDRSEFQVSFEATVYPKVAVKIDKSDVDLKHHQVRVHLNQPISKVEIVVTGDDAKVMARETVEVDDEETLSTHVGWEPSAGIGVLTIDVKVWSVFGFWVSTRITPVEIEIPHEDVEFESGEAVVRASEAPKIDATLSLLREKLQRYGGLVRLQLYVIGYTDTVGSSSANRELSERRARSIAAYFKRSGLPLPIYYQGFGEEVLAVKTPDETPEGKNRRAVYVLAGSPPAPQPSIPRNAWKKL